MTRRKRNASGMRKGRWAVERERCRIARDETGQQPEAVYSIANTIRHLMAGLEPRSASWLEKLHSQWPALVGESVSKHSRPGRIDGKRLVIFVDSSVWLNELSRYWKTTILKSVQGKFGCEKVDAVSFRIDPDRPDQR
ncbi:MAG: DUF721 domain-containing protein [Verrucomicrobiota bacterium]